MSEHKAALHAALAAALHRWADFRDMELTIPLMNVIADRMRGKGFLALKSQNSGIIYSFPQYSAHILIACAVAAGYALRIHDERQARKNKKAPER